MDVVNILYIVYFKFNKNIKNLLKNMCSYRSQPLDGNIVLQG